MHGQPVSAEQWAALRALREGGRPTFVRLGAASNLHQSTIRVRAKRDSWMERHFARLPDNASDRFEEPAESGPEAVPEGWDEMTPAGRLQWLHEFASRKLAEIAVAAETGGALDKGRLDAVWSMLRTVERSETLAQERAAEKETGNDAELAERLRRIDERIVELAEAHADWLVSGGDRQRLG